MLPPGDRLKVPRAANAQVLIIKLADRLHNMRTAWALSPDKARALARETVDVWCPLCEYLGLNAVKSELEDLCFVITDVDTFLELHAQREALMAEVPTEVRASELVQATAHLRACLCSCVLQV